MAARKFSAGHNILSNWKLCIKVRRYYHDTEGILGSIYFVCSIGIGSRCMLDTIGRNVLRRTKACVTISLANDLSSGIAGYRRGIVMCIRSVEEEKERILFS